MKCPKCGGESDESALFCSYCGTKLAEEPQAQPEPQPQLPEVTEVAPVVAPVAAKSTGASGPSNALFIGVIVALVIIIALLAMFVMRGTGQAVSPNADQVAAQPAAEASAPAEAPEESGATEESAAPAEGETPAEAEMPAEGGTPAATPEPSLQEDPAAVANATAVLKKYLAADLRAKGREMQKYLGGQALKRFVPEVQGQEDLTVHSKTITGHDMTDPNTINFTVIVKWSPMDSSNIKTDQEDYVMERTAKGWRITSTPAYPQGE